MAAYPGEANTANSTGQHVSKNTWEGVSCWKVGMEPRVLPVGHPNHDLVLYILHDIFPGLRVMRSRSWYQLTEISRLNSRSYTPGLYVLQVKMLSTLTLVDMNLTSRYSMI